MSNKGYKHILKDYCNYKEYIQTLKIKKCFSICTLDIYTLTNSSKLLSVFNLRKNVIGDCIYYKSIITKDRQRKFLFFRVLTIIMYILFFYVLYDTYRHIGTYDYIYIELGNVIGGTLAYFYIYSILASLSINNDITEDNIFKFHTLKKLFKKAIFPFRHFDNNRFKIYYFLCRNGIFIYTPLGKVEDTSVITDMILYKDIISDKQHFLKTAVFYLDKECQEAIYNFAKSKFLKDK